MAFLRNALCVLYILLHTLHSYGMQKTLRKFNRFPRNQMCVTKYCAKLGRSVGTQCPFNSFSKSIKIKKINMAFLRNALHVILFSLHTLHSYVMQKKNAKNSIGSYGNFLFIVIKIFKNKI